MVNHPRSIAIGIDLATANARAAAVCMETGDVLAEQAASLSPVMEPRPGWAVQRPAYARTVAGLIGGITSILGPRSTEIGALSVTGTSGSFVPSDSQGRPLGNAVLYSDQRDTRQTPAVAESATSSPTSALNRIRWLEEHYGNARYLSTPDVVIADLAGAILPSDTSHFLKTGIDVVNARWPDGFLEQVGLKPESAPDLVHPGTVVGIVGSRAAAVTGLPDHVRIVAGMSDGCTAQIASGAICPGDVAGVLGTTLVLKSVAPTSLASTDKTVYSHRSPEGSFWPGGASNVGAAMLASNYGSNTHALERWSAQARDYGAATAVCYPLAGTGERFPFASRTAKGFFAGGDSGDRLDYFRAILEGVAFIERLGLERLRAMGIEFSRYVVTGGASANTLWNRIRATVLETPVFRPLAHNSAYGAALLAGSSVIDETLSAASARLVRIDGQFDPLESQATPVMDNYAQFKDELARRGYIEGMATGTGFTHL
ncbi:FGGY-family carbohydrate kinase [Arthrobacter sp. H14]|uniref:FGGY-family carbohydrate kinase n=1 Tax=Arthrobacter sp. H14 TaxID=1312959 RepID=UPI0004B9EE7B|nr:FGGY-family carbohydrate kinase [Arthrobacter sp. H14]